MVDIFFVGVFHGKDHSWGEEEIAADTIFWKYLYHILRINVLLKDGLFLSLLTKFNCKSLLRIIVIKEPNIRRYC